MSKNAGVLANGLLLTALMACGLLTFYITHNPLIVSLDTGLYLEAAHVLLQGGLPYVDFWDLNPPLAQYLHVPPVYLAEALNLNPLNSFYLLLVSATLVSSLLTYVLARRYLPEDQQLGAILIALIPALLLFTLDPRMQIGQRVHLFVLALLPYMFLRFNRYERNTIGLGLALSVGILAAATACLKPPYYGSAIVAVELLLISSYKDVRPVLSVETITGLALGILYAASLTLLPAESYDNFFSKLMPLILESYDAYRMSYGRFFAAHNALLWASVPATLGWLALTWSFGSRTYVRLALTAVLLAAIGTLVFIVQGKGWKYQGTIGEFAAIFGTVIFVCSILPRLQNGMRSLRTLEGAAAVAAISGALTLAATVQVSAYARAELTTPLAQTIAEHSSPGDRIEFLGSSVRPQFPLLTQLDRRYNSRYPFSFMVPLLYDASLPDTGSYHDYGLVHNKRRLDPDITPRLHYSRRRLENEYLSALAEDIDAGQPQLIFLLNDDCHRCPEGLTMVKYVYGKRNKFPFVHTYTRLPSTERFLVFKRPDEVDE